MHMFVDTMSAYSWPKLKLCLVCSLNWPWSLHPLIRLQQCCARVPSRRLKEILRDSSCCERAAPKLSYVWKIYLTRWGQTCPQSWVCLRTIVRLQSLKSDATPQDVESVKQFAAKVGHPCPESRKQKPYLRKNPGNHPCDLHLVVIQIPTENRTNLPSSWWADKHKFLPGRGSDSDHASTRTRQNRELNFCGASCRLIRLQNRLDISKIPGS